MDAQRSIDCQRYRAVSFAVVSALRKAFYITEGVHENEAFLAVKTVQPHMFEHLRYHRDHIFLMYIFPYRFEFVIHLFTGRELYAIVDLLEDFILEFAIIE